ncbi:hypothetical protein ACF08B_33195 [Streptomyces sp. NPDC015139]|uniref:hypothetical protein n=1 Tax=Streptomyces sp. NPDC015139 TaxID=3364942 RepID=UPI0036FB0EF3
MANRADALLRAGRTGEALSAAMEAAALFTPLAEAHPEEFTASLRQVLERWACVLELLHRTREAEEVRRRP